MAYSPYATATATTLPVLTPPVAPEWLTPSVGSNRAILRWLPVAGADEYMIEMRLAGGVWDECYTGEGVKVTVNGLTPETDYEFRIKAVNAAGASSWTDLEVRTRTELGFTRIVRFGKLTAATPKLNSTIRGG